MNTDEKKLKKDYLPIILEKTRAARIESERRLLLYDALAKHINIYYACITAFVSLLSFARPENRDLSFSALSLAIVLAFISIFVSLNDFEKRATEMKYCYLELQKLWFELDDKTEEDPSTMADRIGYKYIDVVARTDNHTYRDFVLTNPVHQQNNMQINQLSSCCECKIWALRLFAYASPIVIIFLGFQLLNWI